MSIENNLKRIADAMERMATAQEEILARTTPGVVSAVMTQATAPEEAPVPEVITQQQTESSPPLTPAEMEAFNTWLGQMANYLGQDGQQQIYAVMQDHGVNGLADIGDKRDLLKSIQVAVAELGNRKAAGA